MPTVFWDDYDRFLPADTSTESADVLGKCCNGGASEDKGLLKQQRTTRAASDLRVILGSQ